MGFSTMELRHYQRALDGMVARYGPKRYHIVGSELVTHPPLPFEVLSLD